MQHSCIVDASAPFPVSYRWILSREGASVAGEWVADVPEGRGIYLWADGLADSAAFRAGSYVGDGVRWSADRQAAWRLADGEVLAGGENPSTSPP